MSATIDETLAHLRRRAAAERAAASARAQRLRAPLAAAADRLRARGARRIWLFGSLVTGQVHPASDVDLAVEGLAHDAWVEATGEIGQLLPAAFDLVRIEEAPQSLRERILAEGELL